MEEDNDQRICSVTDSLRDRKPMEGIPNVGHHLYAAKLSLNTWFSILQSNIGQTSNCTLSMSKLRIHLLSLPLSTCVHVSFTPSLLWTSTGHRREIHITLLKQLVQ